MEFIVRVIDEVYLVEGVCKANIDGVDWEWVMTWPDLAAIEVMSLIFKAQEVCEALINGVM